MIIILPAQDTDQFLKMSQQAEGGTVARCKKGLKHILKNLMNNPNLLIMSDPRNKVQKILIILFFVKQILLEKAIDQVIKDRPFLRK